MTEPTSPSAPLNESGPADEFERMTWLAKHVLENHDLRLEHEPELRGTEAPPQVYLAHAFLKFAVSETGTRDAQEALDAARWRKAIKDGEFPKRSKSTMTWMHVDRISGQIHEFDTPEAVMDAALETERSYERNGE